MRSGASGALLDFYVPTRTHEQLELRVRSASAGPVLLRAGDREQVLERPNVSHADRHFYRHRFEGLRPGIGVSVEARLLGSGERAQLETSTLPAPPGRSKLTIGVLSDLHLSTERCGIEAFGRGTKRLYGLACELAEKYLGRLERLGADVIVLPGDVVDPCTDETLGLLQELFGRVGVACHPIIGNHEPWSPGGEARFYRRLGLPEGGYFSVYRKGVRLILLSTPSPSAIAPASEQWRWLEAELRAAPATDDVVVFSHFSLLLHPCVQGANDDGYQLLHHRARLLDLLSSYPNVRVFAAGHKNVPSLLVRDRIVHTLSPQLIQAPCGYDVLHLYDGGLTRTTYEIDEQHYCEVARAGYGSRYPERYGTEQARNFCYAYT